MVTLAIVGILAMVAVPNFLRMRARAKVAEAKANLGAIRITEHAFFAEFSHYVGNQAPVPDRAADPPARFPWPTGTRFQTLGFTPIGSVYFSYGLDGLDALADSFTARAIADLDDDGAWSTWHLTGGDKELYHEGADL